MDEHTRDLALTDVITASDALNNARTVLEEAGRGEAELEEELYEGIRRFVFPLLDAEYARLDAEYRRLRS